MPRLLIYAYVIKQCWRPRNSFLTSKECHAIATLSQVSIGSFWKTTMTGNSKNISTWILLPIFWPKFWESFIVSVVVLSWILNRRGDASAVRFGTEWDHSLLFMLSQEPTPTSSSVPSRRWKVKKARGRGWAKSKFRAAASELRILTTAVSMTSRPKNCVSKKRCRQDFDEMFGNVLTKFYTRILSVS